MCARWLVLPRQVYVRLALRSPDAKARVCEPDKCSEWVWRDNKKPVLSPVFPPLDGMESLRTLTCVNAHGLTMLPDLSKLPALQVVKVGARTSNAGPFGIASPPH